MATDRLKLLDEATKAARRKTGTKCSVCELPKDVLAKVREMVARGDPYSAIEVGLRTIGIEMRQARIAWHFRNHEPQGR